MGNPFLLQACLRLDKKEIPKDLEVGKTYPFSKKEHRLYQIKVPMDLRTNDWDFICRIIITDITIGKDKTEGHFVVVKTFSQQEKEIISKTYVSDEEVERILKIK